MRGAAVRVAAPARAAGVLRAGPDQPAAQDGRCQCRRRDRVAVLVFLQEAGLDAVVVETLRRRDGERGCPAAALLQEAGVVAVAVAAVEAAPGAPVPRPARRVGLRGARRGGVPGDVRRRGRRARPRALLLLPLLRMPHLA